MARRKIYRGRMIQGEHPNWDPLERLVEAVASRFMWMFEVELRDGRRLQAYKHYDTRRYIHLSDDCAAFVYRPEERYGEWDAADVLMAVFAPLPGLAGVTAEYIDAAWEAVDRLERAGDEATNQSA